MRSAALLDVGLESVPLAASGTASTATAAATMARRNGLERRMKLPP
jgi:hypothetical protein